MQLGDLVRSTWDISKGIEGPLGIVMSLKEWHRGNKAFITVRVFLFKSRRIDSFNIKQLEVMK